MSSNSQSPDLEILLNAAERIGVQGKEEKLESTVLTIVRSYSGDGEYEMGVAVCGELQNIVLVLMEAMADHEILKAAVQIAAEGYEKFKNELGKDATPTIKENGEACTCPACMSKRQINKN